MNQLHQSRWDTLTDVARRCVVDKQFDKAEEAYLAALREAEQFGDADPRIAQTLNALARVYHRRSKFFPAAALLHRLLGIKERELGDKHPELAGILSNLAEMYSRLGDLRQELELRERALLLRATEGEQAAGALSGLKDRIEELKRAIAEEEERQAAAREAEAAFAAEKASRRVHVPTGASGLPLILPTPIASAAVSRTGAPPASTARPITPRQPAVQNRLASTPFPSVTPAHAQDVPAARAVTPQAPQRVTPQVLERVTPPETRQVTPDAPASAVSSAGRTFDGASSPQSVQAVSTTPAEPITRSPSPAVPLNTEVTSWKSTSPVFSQAVSTRTASDPAADSAAPEGSPFSRRVSQTRQFEGMPSAPASNVEPLGSALAPAIETRHSPAWSASPMPYEEPEREPELYEESYRTETRRNWRPLAIGGGALIAAAIAAVMLFGGGSASGAASDDLNAQPASAAQTGAYSDGISEQEALDVGLANLREHAPAPGVDMSDPDQAMGPSSEVARRTAEGSLDDGRNGNDSALNPPERKRVAIPLPRVSLDGISDNIDAAARARLDSATAAHDRKVAEYKGNNNGEKQKPR